VLTLSFVLMTILAGAARAEPEPVLILVVKEHGVSAASYAQPYVDKFAVLAAAVNNWPSAKGIYLTNRGEAQTFMASNKPTFGIFSLPAYLALRQKHQMRVVGQVSAALVGGRQYSLVSSAATDLKGCKGKTLATDHADDPRFLDRVVAAGQFTLKDFQLLPTQRPLQTIRKVVNGDAVCALIDDAQLAELAHIEGAGAVRPVWQSAELPPMPLVAFPKATAAMSKGFQDNLGKLCENEAKSTCEEVGIQSLRAASDNEYAALLTAYGKEKVEP